MSEDTQLRKQAVDKIVRGVVIKTSVVVMIVAVAALAYTLISGRGGRWWFLPASILFGGALGLLNFHWLSVTVERVYLRKGATPVGSNMAAAFINLLKLSLIFIILFIVIKWQLLQVFGLVAGLTLCFVAILWEGLTLMKQVTRDEP